MTRCALADRREWRRRWILTALLTCWLAVAVQPIAGVNGTRASEPFPAMFAEAALFTTALENSRAQPLAAPISGVTVPHHLLAVDLIADAFKSLAGKKYERIVLLSPDHYRRSLTPFATTRRGFQTALGETPVDQDAVTALLTNPLVSESNLFSQEHGVHALLPFVAREFPGVPVLVVALKSHSTPAQWDALAATLTPLLTPRTLVVQSTDFSHYLEPADARRHDQQTLRALASGDPATIAALVQPAHLDSRAAQYLQLKLQREVYGARPTVAANRNSQHYSVEPVARTTSYLVQFYSAAPLAVPGVKRWFLGGDTFLGRHLRPVLADPTRRAAMVERVRRITGGDPLIVNLEGVTMPRVPENLGPLDLAMPEPLTWQMLAGLNVVGVTLANNHSHDFGATAYDEMLKGLRAAHVTALGQGEIADFGDFRLVAATDLDNHGEPLADRLRAEDFAAWGPDGTGRPLFAFLHFGVEYQRTVSDRQRTLSAMMEARGVELVIGCHPHVAGELECTLDTCRAWSLGNLIFDQRDPRVSGALLEIDFFEQGTYFLKWHPLGNLYSTAPGPSLDPP